MTRRSSQKMLSAVIVARTVGVILVGSAQLVAAAQEPEAYACLSKTDATGGRMRFAVLEADAAKFRRAGFRQIDCPASPDETVRAQEARCMRLRALASEGKETVRELMGLSVEAMCEATDSWVAARRNRGAQ